MDDTADFILQGRPATSPFPCDPGKCRCRVVGAGNEMRSPDLTREEEVALRALEPRVGRRHIQQRLGLEENFETQALQKETHDSRIEKWFSFDGLIRRSLRLSGLHRRGRRNALTIEIRANEIPIQDLPPAFDGFTLLQLSDLHLDNNPKFLDALIERVRPLHYDLCVLTGDYRARTFWCFRHRAGRSQASPASHQDRDLCRAW